jgi:glucose 1-dehydrogenase
MDLNLRARRVLITGGAGGIGAAAAEAFARENAFVAINYIGDATAATALAQRLQFAGGTALTLAADVGNPAQVAEMFEVLDREWKGIDILINNAGIDGPRDVCWQSDPDSWRNVISVNLFGAYLCARQALRRMVSARKGVIINTTSVHEVIAWTGYSAYAASKAGLSMMSKTLAQEAAPYGVRVLAIAPGAIRTPINQSVWSNSEELRDLLTKIPLCRLGVPADIANLVTVLASDVASYLTGTTVFIDGGMTDYPSFARGG